jgi:hypothetical protein
MLPELPIGRMGEANTERRSHNSYKVESYKVHKVLNKRKNLFQNISIGFFLKGETCGVLVEKSFEKRFCGEHKESLDECQEVQIKIFRES